MSYKCAVLTNPKELRERRAIGGGKTLDEARAVAKAHLESNPTAKGVVITDDVGQEVETVASE